MYRPGAAEIHEIIHHSNLIENINDSKQDQQMFYAWRFLITRPRLTHDVIKDLHEIITRYQDDIERKDKGNYRTTSVTVGSEPTPAPEYVKSLMNNWLMDYDDKSITPKEMHIRFAVIHPFIDGNGRTGRMLLWYIECKRNLKPTFIPVEFKQEYYKWFEGRRHGLAS